MMSDYNLLWFNNLCDIFISIVRLKRTIHSTLLTSKICRFTYDL